MPTRWKILIALTLARTAMGVQFQCVPVTAPLLQAGFGWSAADIGWLVGLYFLPGVAVAMPAGLLGARFGDRRVVVAAFAMMAAGGAMQALAPDLAWAAVARVIGGAGSIVMSVLMTKMVADWFAGHETVLAMSVLVNAWPIGIALASVSLAPLAQSAGVPAAFGAVAAFAAVGLVVVALGYRPAPGAAQAAHADFRSFGPREWRLLPLASMPWALYNVAYSLIVSSLPTWLHRAGMPLAGAGAITALNTVLVAVSVQAGGLIVQRATRRDAVAIVSLAGFGIAFAAMASSGSPVAWLVVAGLLAGIPAGLFVSLPTEVLTPATRAAGMGVFYLIFYAASALLVPLGGVVAQRTGSPAAPLWVAIAMMGFTLAALAAFRAAQRADRRRTAPAR